MLDQRTPKRSVQLGMLLAAVGAIAFSGKAIIVKLGYRYGADAMLLLMLRMIFALPFFVLMAWWSGRGKPALARADWFAVIGLGFMGYYLSSFLDFLGLRYISASFERLILYLNPTFVLLLGWLLHGKRISAWQAAAMGLSYSGVLLVFGHEISLVGADAMLGTLLVVCSAISYAVYLTYSAEIVKKLGAMRLAGAATAVACGFCIAQFTVFHPLDSILLSAPILWLSLLNALLCTVLPVLLVMMAMERIGAGLTAQIGMIGPLSTIGLGAWWLDEPLTLGVVGGTLLVLGGVYLVTQFGHSNSNFTKEK